MATLIKNDCSGCAGAFTLNKSTLVVTMTVPSNGKRGDGHVPAHTVTADAVEVDGLVMWDCPRCEYAESHDPGSEE